MHRPPDPFRQLEAAPSTPRLNAVASPGAAFRRLPVIGDSLLSRPCPTIGLMNSQPEGVVIDAALRFARSNPDLVRFASQNAGTAGASVDDLLREAIERVVAIRSQRDPTVTSPASYAVITS